jgi:hypothetical protein
MNAIPKVGVHLGVIGLHPLDSPSFVRVCFTPKHTFGLMGLCASHFVANPMLGLRQVCNVKLKIFRSHSIVFALQKGYVKLQMAFPWLFKLFKKTRNEEDMKFESKGI